MKQYKKVFFLYWFMFEFGLLIPLKIKNFFYLRKWELTKVRIIKTRNEIFSGETRFFLRKILLNRCSAGIYQRTISSTK